MECWNDEENIRNHYSTTPTFQNVLPASATSLHQPSTQHQVQNDLSGADAWEGFL
jgi:hypothetical protein